MWRSKWEALWPRPPQFWGTDHILQWEARYVCRSTRAKVAALGFEVSSEPVGL